MAIVVRSGEEGKMERKKPAREAPTAGARCDVKVLETRGLRRRKASALSVRSEERRRFRKR